MTTNAARRDMEAADAPPAAQPAGGFIAMRRFGFFNHATRKVVDVAHGERVSIELLRGSVDVAKLLRTGYLRRADEA